MIPFEKARQLVLDAARPHGIEKIPLRNADGRFLARSLKARMDMPRFDQSAMDGFAVKTSDLAGASPGKPAELILDGDLPAGARQRPRLRRGHAIKVFTGSVLPIGADAVVMVEHSREREGVVLLEREPSPGEHIRRRGEEFRVGDHLLARGIRVDPAVAGLLATFGHTEVAVFVRPTVTLLTIGDELVPLGGRLGPAKIFNSNRLSLTAALKRIGVGRIRTRIVRDDPAALKRSMLRGLRESDVLLCAGGASVGDYDFVRPVTAEIGIREKFRAVAVKPGKPVFFGTWRESGRAARTSLVFGLPGNPVSALVSLHQLVRPALLKMMGSPSPEELTLSAELAEECRKRTERLALLRGRLEASGGHLTVRPTRGQESHMMGGMAAADCLIFFPRERKRIEKGERVDVKLLYW